MITTTVGLHLKGAPDPSAVVISTHGDEPVTPYVRVHLTDHATLFVDGTYLDALITALGEARDALSVGS